MSWSATIEDAIRSWVATGTGLTVIWADQNGPRPAAPFVALGRPTIRGQGIDWLDIEENPGGDPGEDQTFTARGPRTVEITAQCFAADATGAAGAAVYLETLRSKARLPSQRATLHAVKTALAMFGPVQSSAEVTNSADIEPRAIATLTFHTTASASELGTWIETADITGTANHSSGS